MKDLAAALLSALDTNNLDDQQRIDDEIGRAPILGTSDMAIFVQRLRSWAKDLPEDNNATHVIREGLDRISGMIGCDPTKHVGDYYGPPAAAFQH